MKRMIAIFLALVLVLSLTACRKAAASRSEVSGEVKQALEQLPLTVAQPESDVKSYSSLKKLNRASGAQIVIPEGLEVQGELFETTNVNGLDLGQYIFTANSIPCTLRFCKDISRDASGVFNGNGGLVFDNVKGDIGFGEDCIVGHWNTGAGQYVLIAATDDITAFSSLFDRFKASIPG